MLKAIDSVHHISDPLLCLDSLSIDAVALIEKEIDPNETISMVFLLYDVPDTALQHLIVYQRVSKDNQFASYTNLLTDWALHVQTRPTWKHELLEALYTCQLYAIIRKMGLNVEYVKRFFESTSIGLLNPIKVKLYRLCEHITVGDLHKLKETLLTYEIDAQEYESCEMVLLELMCKRFITIDGVNTKRNNNIDHLVKILENFSKLDNFVKLFREECDTNDKRKIQTSSSMVNPIKKEGEKIFANDLKDVFENFNDLNINDITVEIKSDVACAAEIYEIKNPVDVGVCLIINQEKFYIENKDKNAKPLEERIGSTRDKNELIKTMKSLKLEVLARDNLNHREMMKCIKDVIKYRFRKDHSMFILCILSHGTRGHIYAADCVQINVEEIENLLDTDEAILLRNKPKLMVLQACQVQNVEPLLSPLARDGPQSPRFKYYIKKSDIIIFWATAPNYAAYRHEMLGSIFIQMLCDTINKYSNKDHVNDLFTKVNYLVKKLCVGLKCEQLPKVEHTLMKKLYLQYPHCIN